MKEIERIIENHNPRFPDKHSIKQLAKAIEQFIKENYVSKKSLIGAIREGLTNERD